MLLFEKGDFLFSFDLKSGYHHVDIYYSHNSPEVFRFFMGRLLLFIHCFAFRPFYSLLYIYQTPPPTSKILVRTGT